MADFSYTEISDYILEQFFGDDSINTLIESSRYLIEDVLNSTDFQQAHIRTLRLANDSATASPDHRGAIYFKGDTTKYFKINHAYTRWETNNNIEIKSPHVLEGDLVNLNFWIIQKSDNLINPKSMFEPGIIAPYDGSIVSFSLYVWKRFGLGSTASADVYINGSIASAGGSVSVTPDPDALTQVEEFGGVDRNTYDRDSITFLEGDFIEVFADDDDINGDYYADIGVIFDE